MNISYTHKLLFFVQLDNFFIIHRRTTPKLADGIDRLKEWINGFGHTTVIWYLQAEDSLLSVNAPLEISCALKILYPNWYVKYCS